MPFMLFPPLNCSSPTFHSAMNCTCNLCYKITFSPSFMYSLHCHPSPSPLIPHSTTYTPSHTHPSLDHPSFLHPVKRQKLHGSHHFPLHPKPPSLSTQSPLTPHPSPLTLSEDANFTAALTTSSSTPSPLSRWPAAPTVAVRATALAWSRDQSVAPSASIRVSQRSPLSWGSLRYGQRAPTHCAAWRRLPSWDSRENGEEWGGGGMRMGEWKWESWSGKMGVVKK